MSTPKRILTIAGEVSGDRIAGAALHKARALARERGVQLELYGAGGDDCARADMHCIYETEEMQVVGFLEVAKKFRFFRKVFRHMVQLLDKPDTKPDVVFLIDYPGFNIRFAREAKARGIRVVYYVSPQVWAWKPGRIRQIVEYVDTMLVIFPFEVDLYKNAGMKDVRFVGHPLIELLDEEAKSFTMREEFARRHKLPSDKPWLVVFPGSREEEVGNHLLDMEDGARVFAGKRPLSETHGASVGDYDVIIVRAPGIHSAHFMILPSDVHVFQGSSRDTHELMHHASLGIFKSGTTTLEAGLTRTPGIICYKTSRTTYMLAKRMMQIDTIGLVNIVLGKKLYPELIQDEMSHDKIPPALREVVSRYDGFIRDLDDLHHKLRGDGPPPSEQAANVLLQ